MKNFINKILDVPKLIRTIWIILWAVLVILLIMKFCFGMWYPIVVKNDALLSFNDFICNSWVRYIILFGFYTVNLNICYLLGCIKKKYDNILEFIIINILIIGSFIVKIFSRVFSVIPEAIISIIIPMIYLFIKCKGFNKWKIILYLVVIELLVFIWQLNIYLVRGIDFAIDSDNHILIGIILQIDYYIFLFITWIGVCFMGLFGIWIFSRDIAVLKSYKEKELSKTKPNMDVVAKIDKRIAKLEKEGN